jgi:hypothetical protein
MISSTLKSLEVNFRVQGRRKSLLSNRKAMKGIRRKIKRRLFINKPRCSSIRLLLTTEISTHPRCLKIKGQRIIKMILILMEILDLTDDLRK